MTEDILTGPQNPLEIFRAYLTLRRRQHHPESRYDGGLGRIWRRARPVTEHTEASEQDLPETPLFLPMPVSGPKRREYIIGTVIMLGTITVITVLLMGAILGLIF